MALRENETQPPSLRQRLLRIAGYCVVKLSRADGPYNQYRVLIRTGLGIPTSWGKPTDAQRRYQGVMFPGSGSLQRPPHSTIIPPMDGGAPRDL